VVEERRARGSPGTPVGYHLSGVLVEPAWRGRGYRGSANPGPPTGQDPHWV